MKHSFSLTAAALALVCLAVFGLYCAAGQTPPGENTQIAQSAPAPETQSAAAEPEEALTLGVFDGKLALFTGPGRYPTKVYDLLVRTLPREDRARLESGIPVSSDEELRSLLEDFMS